MFALVMSLNFHRRHLKPHEKGKALADYMERVGAKKQQGKRTDKTKAGTSATLAEVADKLGVPEATARYQLKAAEDYQAAAPEQRAKVDAGEITPKQARAAKEALPHGEFGRLFSGHDRPIEGHLPFVRQWAQRLMAIAGNPVIANVHRGGHLPADLNALHELATMKAAELTAAIESGKVTPRVRHLGEQAPPAPQQRAARRDRRQERRGRGARGAGEGADAGRQSARRRSIG